MKNIHLSEDRSGVPEINAEPQQPADSNDPPMIESNPLGAALSDLPRRKCQPPALNADDNKKRWRMFPHRRSEKDPKGGTVSSDAGGSGRKDPPIRGPSSSAEEPRWDDSVEHLDASLVSASPLSTHPANSHYFQYGDMHVVAIWHPKAKLKNFLDVAALCEEIGLPTFNPRPAMLNGDPVLLFDKFIATSGGLIFPFPGISAVDRIVRDVPTPLNEASAGQIDNIRATLQIQPIADILFGIGPDGKIGILYGLPGLTTMTHDWEVLESLKLLAIKNKWSTDMDR